MISHVMPTTVTADMTLSPSAPTTVAAAMSTTPSRMAFVAPVRVAGAGSPPTTCNPLQRRQDALEGDRDRGDADDVAEEHPPAGEPVDRRAREAAGPLRDAAGDRGVGGELGEDECDAELPREDQRPRPEEGGPTEGVAEGEQLEDRGEDRDEGDPAANAPTPPMSRRSPRRRSARSSLSRCRRASAHLQSAVINRSPCSEPRGRPAAPEERGGLSHTGPPPWWRTASQYTAARRTPLGRRLSSCPRTSRISAVASERADRTAEELEYFGPIATSSTRTPGHWPATAFDWPAKCSIRMRVGLLHARRRPTLVRAWHADQPRGGAPTDCPCSCAEQSPPVAG